MLITIQAGGRTNILDTEATTVGELFADNQFREDFIIPDRAIPTVSGQNVDNSTPLSDDMGPVSFVVGASSKSHTR